MALELIDSSSMEEEKKPREKIQHYNVEALDDHELLSVVLGTGYGGLNVEQLSKHLMSEFGLRGLFQFKDLGDFQENTGLPLVKSCKLLAVGEYFRRLKKKDHTPLKSSEAFYDYIRDDFKRSSFEQLRITCLDPQRRVLFSGLVAQGRSNKLSVTLACVLHHPIRLNAKHFYLAHNHSEGIITPSEQDIAFTLQVKEAAQNFGLHFDDHLIVGEDGFYSFSLKGIL